MYKVLLLYKLTCHKVSLLYELKFLIMLHIDESKHYVTNQYHSEHYGLYLKAGKYSGWQ